MSATLKQKQNLNSSSGAIVLVAKCPIPGKSKTRLSKLLGDDGSAALAKSMLSDVLETIGYCAELDSIPKVLLYAPGTPWGAKHMSTLLSSLEFSSIEVEYDSSEQSNKTIDNSNNDKQNPITTSKNTWILLPMISSDLTSSNLGDKLSTALHQTRSILLSQTNPFHIGNVVFLGMDSPIIPLPEIMYSLSSSEYKNAHLCPAQDGGYGMISIPSSIPSHLAFRGVRWSNPLTAISQLKALTDSNSEIIIRIGQMMNDVDEPDDVWDLAEILVRERNNLHKAKDCMEHENATTETSSNKNDCEELDALSQLSQVTISSNTFNVGKDKPLSCKHTWQSLLDQGLIQENNSKDNDEKFLVCKDT